MRTTRSTTSATWRSPRRLRERDVAQPETPSPLDVVLITVDSLRPDRLGVYNRKYRKPQHRTTPLLDEWAQQATVFENAFTSGGWTSVAMPSLMRGLFPRHMRWTYFYETTYYEMIRKPLKPKLRPGEQAERIYPLAFDDPRPSLAQRLQRRGMRTIAVVDDGYSQIFQRLGGASLGFDVYLERDKEPRARASNAGVVDLALQQLRRVRKRQRFFLWVHLFGVHGPDDFYPGVPTFGDSQSGRYDHEVAGLDPDLNRLLAALDSRPDKPAIFVTADHGEELNRGPRNHGFSLDDVILRVPLIARVPGWPIGRVADPVSIVDIMPTILAVTQTPAPAALDGRDLARMAQGLAQPPRILLADTWQLDAQARRTLEYVAAFDGVNKVIYDRKQHLMMMHERDRDPGRPLRGNAIDSLSRAILAYLDETGGELNARY
jgi:arylsulfatase A-like enzyme